MSLFFLKLLSLVLSDMCFLTSSTFLPFSFEIFKTNSYIITNKVTFYHLSWFWCFPLRELKTLGKRESFYLLKSPLFAIGGNLGKTPAVFILA